MNLQKFSKKRNGRGMRNRLSMIPKAKVIHLSRILLFLRKNPEKSYTRKEIGENTCMHFGYVDSALKFLDRENFVKSKLSKSNSNTTFKILKYSIK